MDVLEGLRVVDFSESLAGPYCAQILADLGADVIKVERPGGDPARAWGPPFWEGEAAMFLAANRGKRSVVLDLKSEAGGESARRLLTGADVAIQSFRAGVADALGIGWEAARALNPRLIYCSITAFGTRGPRRDLPGYDPMIQAYAGIMSVTGYPGAPPARLGISAIDMGTGQWAALGILAALRRRDARGGGSHVVASLLDTALGLEAYHLVGHLATGGVPGPEGSGLAMIAPYAAYPAADGWLMISAANDGLFRRLCGALGAEPLLEDPRFVSNPARVAHRAELNDAMAAHTRRFDMAELRRRIDAAGVPNAPLHDMAEVAADEQVAATGMLRAAEHPRIDGYREVALPLEWDGERPAGGRPPPLAGEHTAEILAELDGGEGPAGRDAPPARGAS